MGKGTIISGGTGGLYQVQINYDNSLYDQQTATLTEEITTYTSKINDKEGEIAAKQAEIAAESDQLLLNQLILQLGQLNTQKSILILRKMAYEKRLAYMQNKMPADTTVSAWCADLTENLTGVVGTVEAPGYEITDNSIQIKPGYVSAAWSSTTDKQLLPEVSMSPNQSYYNRAVLPAVEKWEPRYRYGTITGMAAGLASITLDSATSSQQNLNLNQTTTLSSVPFEYMQCDDVAFEVGDSVLIQFAGNDWASPKIIGFKDNPAACAGFYYPIYTTPGPIANPYTSVGDPVDITLSLVYLGSGAGNVPAAYSFESLPFVIQYWFFPIGINGGYNPYGANDAYMKLRIFQSGGPGSYRADGDLSIIGQGVVGTFNINPYLDFQEEDYVVQPGEQITSLTRVFTDTGSTVNLYPAHPAIDYGLNVGDPYKRRIFTFSHQGVVESGEG